MIDSTLMTLASETALSCLKLSLAAARSIAGSSRFVWFAFEHSDKRESLYNILWAMVFAFATLNILGLLARRFESGRNRLSFGEVTAILVVGLSVVLLGMEMLNLFKIFPIRLENH